MRLTMLQANNSKVRSLFRFRAPRERNSLSIDILFKATFGQVSKAVKDHFKVND